MSYPYIYKQLVEVVSNRYIAFEQIVSCVGIVFFSALWNKFGDTLFRHYLLICITEIVADTFLFTHVFITGDLKFYFVLNVLIYAVITKNLCCGGIRMRARVNPTEIERERYDNNANMINSVATLIGTGFALVCNLPLRILFILALIGNISDNFMYIYIYEIIRRRERC